SSEAVCTLARRRPSIGEILFIFALPRLRDHSPSNTPALSSVRPNSSKNDFINNVAYCHSERSEESQISSSSAEKNQRCFAPLNMTGLHASTFLLPPLSTELAHGFHRFINHAGGNIERGTETDRVLTRTKSQDAAVEEAMPKFFSRFRIGQIEGEK